MTDPYFSAFEGGIRGGVRVMMLGRRVFVQDAIRRGGECDAAVLL